MYPVNFIEVFAEIYNLLAAFAIIIFCIYLLLKMHQTNQSLLKARVFLNSALLQQVWVYISVAGASFALNTFLKLAISLKIIGDTQFIPYMVGLTQIIFVISFILAIDCCCLLLGGNDTNRI